MTYTAQELNTKIVLSHLEEAAGPGGDRTRSWTQYAEAFAKIEPLVGNEFFAAASTWPHVPVKVTMRHRQDVLTSDRITIRGEHYNITSIQEIKFRRRELLIYAERNPLQ
ncbi:phage head closure protein [Luteimonas aquatica]|uniref:phage head closure protein n=1 Tax=Luteimonas aquatica TaxID=450364 RepID=UPI001F59C655|nr:phage head closure protein [Luteimonas aquatica]